MSPLSFAITAALSAAALAVNAGASGVLINAALGMGAVLLVRTALGDLSCARILGMPSARFRAQLALLTLPGRRGRPRGIAQIVAAYGLTPTAVSAMTPDGRLAERDRLGRLLGDMDRMARLRPLRPLLPDPGRLRRALAARAGASAPSYASIFDAACLALDQAARPEPSRAAAA